jgi:hypothetical protein
MKQFFSGLLVVVAIICGSWQTKKIIIPAKKVVVPAKNVAPVASTRLFDMAGTADKIAVGVVTKVDDKFFYVDQQNEKGRKETLKILKLSYAPPHARWKAYEPGQKLYLFLKKSNDGYTVMGNAGEGEIPVIKDSVVIDMRLFTPKTNQTLAGPKGITPEYKERQTFQVGSQKVFGLRFGLAYFRRSVSDFNNCYQVLLKIPGGSASHSCFNFFERYTRSKINSYKSKSLLLQLIYNDMEAAQIANCNK